MPRPALSNFPIVAPAGTARGMSKALTALLAAVLLLSASACRDDRGDERAAGAAGTQADAVRGARAS